MFQGLLSRLSSPTPIEATDTQLALAALLVRVAKSDSHYDATEIGQIDKILSARFGLNPVEAMKLRAQCEHLEHDAPDTQDFAAKVKELVCYEERSAIVAEVWNVVMADGVERNEEKCLFTAISDTLGVDTADLRDRQA